MSKQHHSLKANLAGSIFIALLLNSPLMLVSLLFIRWVSGETILFADIVAISITSALVSSVIIALVDRSYRIKHDTYVPSGFVPTIYEAIPWVVITSVTTVVLLQSYQLETALWGALAGLLGGTIPALAIGVPWKGTATDEEYEERLQEGNRIIKEGFAEIREEIREKREKSR